MSSSKLSLLAVGALLALGCKEYPLVGRPNTVPTATAQIIGPDGQVALNPIPPATCDQPHPETLPRQPAHAATFDYNGTDVTVTLDASKSVDPDGTIKKYTWLSGTKLAADAGEDMRPLTSQYQMKLPDGGLTTVTTHGGTRWVPPGAGPDWPPDAKQVQVALGQGVWSFVLWVTDNKGAISDPDTITITIGVDPRIKACMADVLPVAQLNDDCKTCICSQSDTCRMNVVQSACDANCWGLIGCIAMMCPTFAKTMDTSCVVNNCSMYLAGATAATAAGACVVPCTSCAPPPKCDAGM